MLSILPISIFAVAYRILVGIQNSNASQVPNICRLATFPLYSVFFLRNITIK